MQPAVEHVDALELLLDGVAVGVEARFVGDVHAVAEAVGVLDGSGGLIGLPEGLDRVGLG